MLSDRKALEVSLLEIFNFLFLVELPEIGPFSFSKEVMNEGDFAQISCIVTSGDKPLSIKWSFHGLNTGSQGSDNGITTTNIGGRMSMLVIEKVKHTHQGNYTCQSTNQAGTSSHTAQLRVNGKCIFCFQGHRMFALITVFLYLNFFFRTSKDWTFSIFFKSHE